VDPKSKSPRSLPISLPVILPYTSLPRTTVCHIQNWSLPLPRSGRTHTWLVVAHVHPGWSLQELVLNMIWVTYQTRGLPVTPRSDLKLLVSPDTPSKLVTQILPHVATKRWSIFPHVQKNQLIKIRPKTNPIPKALLSVTYPETHPITWSIRNSKEG
jgi:hypothetical protein